MPAPDYPYPTAEAKPWGLLATCGLAAIVWYTLELLQAAMGYSLGQVLTGFKLIDPGESLQAISFALITCFTTVLCGALVFAAAALKIEMLPRDYLALGPVPAALTARWLIAMAVIVLQADLVLYLVKGELLPAQWVEVYRSVNSPVLFWFALVVATPIFEELLFRGFIFAGIRASWLGDVGAVLITAIAWTAIHQEYDPLEFVLIFIVGVVLGIARLRTGSVLVTIAMHMLHNLISAGEIAWLAGLSK